MEYMKLRLLLRIDCLHYLMCSFFLVGGFTSINNLLVYLFFFLSIRTLGIGGRGGSVE